ncbi:MAG: APC family permease [Planctomycetaceae bacterium]|nr:APC family permease [Planctomycetaceae bacterium]
MTLPESDQPHSLSRFDMACLLVGIVVGTAIFEAPPTVFSQFNHPLLGFSTWLLGGLLAFSGALCYAELAAAYPQFGAEYVYLGRAYGRRVAFLFAWMQMTVVATGSIGAMSFVFVNYASHLLPTLNRAPALVAMASLVCLLALQIAGLRTGKFVQNLLTVSKLVALGGLLLVGCLQLPSWEMLQPLAETSAAPASGSFSLALILVLFAYAGWNDSTSVAPEVKDVQRNLPQALLYGLGFIAALYLGINFAYLNVLGFTGLRESSAPAAEVMQQMLGPWAAATMSLVVMISSLGAIHGTMFAGSRLLAAVGHDYPALGAWRRWNARGAPAAALCTLAGISCVMILLAGTDRGVMLLRGTTARLVELIRPAYDTTALFANEYGPQTGFEILVAAASPVFLLFFTLTGLALIVLRFTDTDHPRPFRVPLYPLTPLIFCASAGFMFYSSLQYAGLLVVLTAPLLLAGLLLAASLQPAKPD